MERRERQVLQLAATQYGVVSRAQALERMSARQLEGRVRQGAWERLFPRAYRIEGSRRCWRQRLKALSLSVSKGYALSHATAAALHGFRGFEEGPLVVSVMRRVALPRPVEAHEVLSLAPRDLASVEGLTVTSVTRTLLDLASTEPRDVVTRALDEALGRKWTTLDRLEATLARTPWRQTTTFLSELITRYRGGDGPTESELERLIVELLEAEGIPRPVCQRVVKTGHRFRRLDLLFPDELVVIEADGYAYHSSPDAFEKDRRRNNSLIARGYLVLHWTWKALHDRPHELIRELRLALASRAARNRPWR